MTPVARVAGRRVTTLDGLPDADGWARPSPPRRLAVRVLHARDHRCAWPRWPAAPRRAAVDRASPPTSAGAPAGTHRRRRSVVAIGPTGPSARRRWRAAAASTGAPAAVVGADVALGAGGSPTTPRRRRARRRARRRRDWVVGETLAEARAAGRQDPGPALDGAADVAARRARRATGTRTLQTTWVEPAYLEPDASWCEPGGEPVTPLANGGAFGGKVDSRGRRRRPPPGRRARPAGARAAQPARTSCGGPKRPPIAAGVRADGTGVVRVVARRDRRRRSPRWPRAHASRRSTSPVRRRPRAARPGWAEAAVLSVARPAPDTVVAPTVPRRRRIVRRGVHVRVRCGDPLDEVVLRSYCTGAAHMALGWVRSEGLAVDDDGVPVDLTIRSFGILRASRRRRSPSRSSPTTASR